MPLESSIPQLEGETCIGLVVQECFYRDELVENANVVFFATAPSRWWRFFIDGGDFGIALLGAEAPAPIDDAVPEFAFPLIDYASRYPVVGQRVVSALLNHRPAAEIDGATLTITFADGSKFVVCNENDASTARYLASHR